VVLHDQGSRLHGVGARAGPAVVDGRPPFEGGRQRDLFRRPILLVGSTASDRGRSTCAAPLPPNPLQADALART
jgi:hypothetical protein